MSIQGKNLHISGKTTCSPQDKFCLERSLDETVSLSDPQLDMDSVQVLHKDGVLKVEIAKKQVEESGKRVLPILSQLQ